MKKKIFGKSNEREMEMLVAESKSNVLRTGSGSDSFNLFCFTRSGLENYHFSEENLAQMVDLFSLDLNFAEAEVA